MKTRPSDWEQLILDYNRDNRYIKAQKRSWLPPKPSRRRYERVKVPKAPETPKETK